ncbi:DUF2817 domain-containing protein [Tumebacillus sp. DT12]|uniref:DUF2817 domain-containing protein n=1 Tax=Tumebacillus lacus TaxID=2995335 RepID=A0ABT3X070_9BACL|nr:M14 family zinc carboxypeptidase [Tumebacillus lacus]MCX7570299.1 DUF2817 domain-containing protein [Tumebacillus lacus]
MKKQVISGLLSLSLMAGLPYAVLAEAPSGQAWTNVNAYETNESNGSLFNTENYDFVRYSQFMNELQAIVKQSNRVKVEVTGQSAAGRDLYTVTISNPSDGGKFGYYQGLRKQMFKSSEKAEDFIAKHPDFKVPVLVNASIHGTEFVGSDAALKLIKRFALDNDEQTQTILDNTILIFNLANPDGRVNATRFNSSGIDLNRDFITQSQPETRQTVGLITEWNPMVMLDLHGYVKNYAGPGRPGLIEPCTPPHNPNYEYDLFSKWMTAQAEAMEGEIVSQQAQYKGPWYENMTGTYIPQRDDSAGWDDYPPIFTPMYAMYHGTYGYTLEAPTNDWDGVQWHYDATMGALKHTAENKAEMIKDQIEMFRRGIQFDHPYHEDGHFPTSYILPVDGEDPTVTEKAVAHLLTNDIAVEQAQKAFTVDGTTYPAGTYVVPMDQAKAGLANTLLWEGEDISNDTPAMYDISSWSLPQLWGFAAVATQSDVTVQTQKVNAVASTGELIGKGPYKIPNSSVKAVRLANDLLAKGVEVKRDAAGDFYVAAQSGHTLKELVKASGLSLQTTAVPSDATAMTKQKVAILKDGGYNKGQAHAGTHLALKRLGFDVTEVTPVQVATNGLQGYDAFLYNGSERLIAWTNSAANQEFGLQSQAQFDSFKANVTDFVNEGGHYVAIGTGSATAAKQLGLTDITVNAGSSNSNGIVSVNYSASPLTLGYKSTDIGFVYRPAWFTNTAGTDVVATYANTPDFFLSGHWRNNTAAAGKAVIVQEQDQNVTLIGLEAGFRDHTEYLYRLLSNAVYAK